MHTIQQIAETMKWIGALVAVSQLLALVIALY